MYTQNDIQLVEKNLHKRLILTFFPSFSLCLFAVAYFIYGQLMRSDKYWLPSTIIFIIGGILFIFLFNLYYSPLLQYKKHIVHMMTGKQKTTSGIFKSISDEKSYRDGLDCFALKINIGTDDNPMNDRLFYFDAYKERPQITPGTKVEVFSNNNMVSNIQTIDESTELSES